MSTSLQLRSRIQSDATLVLSLAEVPIPEPGEHEVLVRVGAAPLNPSDLLNMFGTADMTTARAGGSAERPQILADVPEKGMPDMTGRLDQDLPVGNEGSGAVVATGSSPQAKALEGRTVSFAGGASYSQYTCVPAMMCLTLPEGTTPREGAGSFGNPLSALAILETMRLDGHEALVHTAAASNLGQMLVKLCLADGVPLVNIVRRPAQAELLRHIGAKHVCDSSDPNFEKSLIDALVDTGARLAFDATGGGPLASQILTCMEAPTRRAPGYSRYTPSVHKQVYIYGGLDPSPTHLVRDCGMAYSVSGWLIMDVLQRIGLQRAQELRQRIVAELKTTFASSFAAEISLAEALDLDVLRAYSRHATGQKHLINPSKDAG